MSILDVLQTSFLNLWRRKLRAFLTVLGMVIGTTSIVVMVSLGIGIKEATIQSFAQTGSLTTITVDRWKTTEATGNSGAVYTSQEQETKLDKKSIAAFEKLPGVRAVMPLQTMSGILKCGRYVTDAYILGVDADIAKEFEITLGEGTYPDYIGKTKFQIVFSAYTLDQFFHPDTGKQAVDRNGNSKINLDNRFQLTFDYSQVYSWASSDENTTPPGKFYTVTPTGVISADSNNYSWYCLMDLESFTKLAKENEAFVGKKVTSEFYQVLVKCNSLDDVRSVKNAISDMGYGTYSMLDAVEMAQESTQRVQILLGAIGGVSLLVAAIGIMNTMMMSIYERTKEIGIIKVLGCSMGNIAALFLTESVYIGLFGGAIGTLLSYGMSFVLNRFLVDYGLTSVIPPVLVLGAVAFSVVVAMVSGLYPSFRAMRLSPLSAIRNE